MGNILEFPNRYQRLINLAKKAETKSDLNKLIQIRKEIYQINPDPSNNYLLVKTLYSNNEYESCLNFIDHHKDFYFQNIERLELLFNCYLYCEEFELAKELLNEGLVEHDDEDKLQEKYDEKLNQKITKLNQEKEVVLKALYSLGHYDRMEQINLASRSILLEIDQLVKVSELTLINPYVDPVAKTAIVESLIRRQYKQTLTIELFERNYQFNPSQLNVFDSDPMLLRFKEILENDVGHDPQTYAMILNEVTYDLMIIFPANHEIIQKLSIWLSFYYKKYGLVDTENLNKKSRNYLTFLNVQDYKN